MAENWDIFFVILGVIAIVGAIADRLFELKMRRLRKMRPLTQWKQDQRRWSDFDGRFYG